MNLSLISNDSDLRRAFEESGYFKVFINNRLEDAKEAKVIIVSDQQLNYNDLSLFLETDNMKLFNDKFVFFMLSNTYSVQMVENISSISRAKNIIIIPPKLTIAQIIDRVIMRIFPNVNEKNKKIVTFFGADTKVGTTMVTQSIAEMLTQQADIKIALFFLNNNPSIHYLKRKEKISLDDIKIKLMNNILSSNELLEACIREDRNLYILPGPEYILDVRHYHPEHIDRLISLAAEKFDLVLIDAGSNIDSGMAIAALNATKYKYLVTTQQEIARKNYERIDNQVFKRLQIESKDFMLIVNKYLKSGQIHTANQVAGLYKMTLATYIPNLELLGWQAEYDYKTLLHYDNEDYNHQIEQISKLIAIQTNMPLKEVFNKKDGFLKRTFGTLGGLM